MVRPKGAENKDKPWRDALRKAVAKRDGRGNSPKYLERIADRVVKDAEQGVVPAYKEIGDRLDGKAVQGVQLDVAVTITAIERTIVDPVKVIDGQVIGEVIEDKAEGEASD